MTDAYDDPTREQRALVLVALFVVLPYLFTTIYNASLPLVMPRKSANHPVVLACVREKGEWPCFLALSDDEEITKDGQLAAKKRLSTGSLLSSFRDVVSAPQLLDSCARTPICIMAMVRAGYAKQDIIEVLEQ